MKKLCTALACLLTSCLFFACKDKKEDKSDESFIPVTAIIRGQLNDIDTSLYQVIKLTLHDTLSADTEYIRREDVRALASDFLDLPHFSKKHFTEENIPGPTEALSTISYKPIKPEKEQIQRIDLVIDPALSETGQNVIRSIYIDKGITNRDSAIEKKLLWQIDQSFQVTTILQKKGQNEVTSTYRVIWNDIFK